MASFHLLRTQNQRIQSDADETCIFFGLKVRPHSRNRWRRFSTALSCSVLSLPKTMKSCRMWSTPCRPKIVSSSALSKIGTLSIVDEIGRRRRKGVKFSRANFLAIRQVVKTSSSLRRRRHSGRFAVSIKLYFLRVNHSFPPCHLVQVEIYYLWISRIQMLITLSIYSPANLNVFFRFGLSENLQSDGGTASRKTSKLSSASFRSR